MLELSAPSTFHRKHKLGFSCYYLHILFGYQIIENGNLDWLPTGYPVTNFSGEWSGYYRKLFIRTDDKNPDDFSEDIYKWEVIDTKNC